MKKWILIQFIVIAIIAIFGVTIKATVSSSAISSMYTQENTLIDTIGVEYAIDDVYAQSLISDPEAYDNIRKESQIILIGTPSGAISQEGDIFGQEVIIKEIIKGEEMLKSDGLADTLYVFSADGFFDADNGKIMYRGGYGLMQKSSEYLIFLTDLPQFTELLSVEGYYNNGGFFGQLKLNNREDQSKPINTPIEDLRYIDVWDYEFIAESQNVLDQMYLTKERLLTIFGEYLD
jgi:hypothetical protein